MHALKRGPTSLTLQLYSRAPHFPLLRSSLLLRVASLSQPSVLRPVAHCDVSPSDLLGQVAHFSAARTNHESTKDQDVAEDIAITRFRELGEQKLVSQNIVDTLTRDMGLDYMTEVQSLTFNKTLQGRDILAQARTGTGKTLAFLIPIVQNLIERNPDLEFSSRSPHRRRTSGFGALIISPTRELAEQIATEARKLTNNTGIKVRTAVGGVDKRRGLRQIQEGCDILVGTPGRLKDILSDPYSRVRAPALSTLVLDEADRLLEQGFEPEIRAIQELLPDKRSVPRQTLLFSATMPQEVMPIVNATLSHGFDFVRTFRQGEQPTHESVPQKLVHVGGLENQMTALVELCLNKMNDANKDRPFKAIIFFPAIWEVVLGFEVLKRYQRSAPKEQSLMWPQSTSIMALHSKLPQGTRARAAESFKDAKSAVLLATDVAARGMDFPNVTQVIQIGLPQSEEHYVHRIGRTARAGKKGEAWLLIWDLEQRELRNRLRRMPLQQDMSLSALSGNMKGHFHLDSPFQQIHQGLLESYKSVPEEIKLNTYLSNLGVYSWIPDKQALVKALNTRVTEAWSGEPPPIRWALAQKLGLARVRELRIEGGDDESRWLGPRSSTNERLRRRNKFPSHQRGDRAPRGRGKDNRNLNVG